MYAIVKVGGKQHKVSAGDKLKVEKLGKEPGATVEWPALLVVDGDQVLAQGDGKEAMVTAKVLGDGQLKKVLVLHKKRRKQYKKIYGPRQPYTQVEILGISKA